MTRHLLTLAALFIPLLRAHGAEPELDLKYRLEAEIRKEGAPRTVAIDAYFEKAAGRLYYTTPDGKSLTTAQCAAPNAAKGVMRPKWVRGFDLRVSPDERDCSNAPKVTVEVFRDAGQLLYVTESGGGSSLPEPAGAAKAAQPRWLYRLQLKVRPSGENDFTRAALKLNVEVYLHEPTGHLIYLGRNGALAVVETRKDFRTLTANVKAARWSQGLVLKARKPDQKAFGADTPRIGVEVYGDDNAGVVLYATESLALAAVPGDAPEAKERGTKDPQWQQQLLAGKFAAEVFANLNANHTVAVTHTGALTAWVTGVKPEKGEHKTNGVKRP